MPDAESGKAGGPPAAGPRPKLLLCGLAAAAALAGCQRDEVAHFRVPKAPAAPAGMAAMAPGGMGGGDVAPPPTPTGAGALRWTLPQGWSESRGSGGMRYATLTAPGAGKLDVSVVVLPGPAGGELANVNRWRNQIGLAPLGEGDLAGARTAVKSKAGTIALYDFTSEGTKRTRVVAGYTFADGNTWFVKMTGDAEAVKTARPAFLSLVESLRFDASNP